MFGIGKPARPKAVAFDIIGTVFPLEPLRSSIVALGLPPSGLEGWFAAGCRDAFALAAAGDFEPFTTVLEGALGQVLGEQNLTASVADMRALVKQIELLDPRPDARAAFESLATSEISVLALSNGAKSSTKSLLDRAGLTELTAAIVSVNEVKRSKPRREVYEYTAKEAGVKPRDLALVAAHPWDINGAAAAGLITGYLACDRPYPKSMRLPNIEAESLHELAGMFVAL